MFYLSFGTLWGHGQFSVSSMLGGEPMFHLFVPLINLWPANCQGRTVRIHRSGDWSPFVASQLLGLHESGILVLRVIDIRKRANERPFVMLDGSWPPVLGVIQVSMLWPRGLVGYVLWVAGKEVYDLSVSHACCLCHIFVVCVDCVRALFIDWVLWVSTGQQVYDARGRIVSPIYT